MDIEKEERARDARRFSRIWWKSRADAKVSQEYVALGMGISRKTVQNWEKGFSSPSLFQGAEWFKVLGLNPLPYFLDYIFPKNLEGITGSADDKRVTDALNSLVAQLPMEGKRQLLYILYGNHGSSPQAMLNLMTAHLHTPMKDRIVQATVILENYELEKEMGNLACPENIQPNTELLKLSVRNAKECVKNEAGGYSNMELDEDAG